MPNGGEVVLDNPLNDFSQAVEALRCMHVSYLNAEHDLNVLRKWNRPCMRARRRFTAEWTAFPTSIAISVTALWCAARR